MKNYWLDNKQSNFSYDVSYGAMEANEVLYPDSGHIATFYISGAIVNGVKLYYTPSHIPCDSTIVGDVCIDNFVLQRFNVFDVSGVMQFTDSSNSDIKVISGLFNNGQFITYWNRQDFDVESSTLNVSYEYPRE